MPSSLAIEGFLWGGSMWSEHDRAEIIEQIDRALPAYEAIAGRISARPRHSPALGALLALLCVSIGLVVAFWVFPARPGPFIVTVPVFPLFGATGLARWLGGAVAGWSSAVLSLIAVAYFWLPSIGPGSVAWLFGIALTFACIASSAGSPLRHIPFSSGGDRYRKVVAAE